MDRVPTEAHAATEHEVGSVEVAVCVTPVPDSLEQPVVVNLDAGADEDCDIVACVFDRVASLGQGRPPCSRRRSAVAPRHSRSAHVGTPRPGAARAPSETPGETLGAGEGTRTLGLLITSELLYRLSYSGEGAAAYRSATSCVRTPAVMGELTHVRRKWWRAATSGARRRTIPFSLIVNASRGSRHASRASPRRARCSTSGGPVGVQRRGRCRDHVAVDGLDRGDAFEQEIDARPAQLALVALVDPAPHALCVAVV